MHPEVAITKPRFGTDHFMSSFKQAPPRLGSLVLPKTFDQKIQQELAARGHKITPGGSSVNTRLSLLRYYPDTGMFEAAGDPNGRRSAAAY
jgi:hypothetical protein